MTDEKKAKQKPDFHIFKKEGDGKSTYMGAAFRHATGDGFNIVMGDKRFVAFPPKDKPEKETSQPINAIS